MATQTSPFTMKVLRHVFAAWWISIPLEFDEEFDDEDRYWHAWDDRRSVSLTSIVVTDPSAGGRPVTGAELLAAIPALEGEPVEVPPRFQGWAVVVRLDDSPRASRALAGMLAVDGRILMATITSDDIAWATDVWNSIEYAPTPIAVWPAPNRAQRRAAGRSRDN